MLGGAAGNELVGNDQDNILAGGDGDDKIWGGRGNDLLAGGDGVNDLSGEAGADVYRFADPTTTAVTTLHEDLGTVGGGALTPGGTDTIDLSALTSAVTFNLASATNNIGLIQIELLDSSGAAAPENFENIVGSATASNQLYGNDAANILVGGSRNDTLRGGAESDVLVGLDGADALTGNAGRNLIIGGWGLDSLVGGSSEEILISGSTIYDLAGYATGSAPFPELAQIRLAWLSSAKDYEARIDQIMAGLVFGENPDELLRLVGGDTVLSDLVAETLDGARGRDWFFRGLLDTVLSEPDERIDLA